MDQAVDLLIDSIGELVTACEEAGPIHGARMGEVKRVSHAAVAVRSGEIVAAGQSREVRASVPVGDATEIIDAEGRLVTPGLIDPHTHMIFAGDRAGEFIMRCQGKTYAEIAAAGGGIVASMKATRKATLEDLVALGLTRLRWALEHGTTTCEIKTGYGLDLESELRMLEAVGILARSQPVELAPTFMPAHAIPPGVQHESYVEEIIGSILPRAKEFCRGGSLSELPAPFIDVFCDEGYFTLEETRRILEAGLKLGFRPKVHADEFANLGAAELAVELGAASADHLLSVSDREIDLLAGSNVVAVLLPGTSFYLNLAAHAPARKMIERGVAVALGSDFNPGSCHIFSLPLIWGLACLHLKMTPEEALTALTANAACAIGKGDRTGRLQPGYQADLTVFDVQRLEEVPYHLGRNPVLMCFKRGRLVCDRRASCRAHIS